MHTEDEAKHMACHRTLCADIWSNPKENEGEAKTAWTPCLGATCMAWCWGVDENGEPAYRTVKIPNEPGYYESIPEGYCGLAGKP